MVRLQGVARHGPLPRGRLVALGRPGEAAHHQHTPVQQARGRVLQSWEAQAPAGRPLPIGPCVSPWRGCPPRPVPRTPGCRCPRRCHPLSRSAPPGQTSLPSRHPRRWPPAPRTCPGLAPAPHTTRASRGPWRIQQGGERAGPARAQGVRPFPRAETRFGPSSSRLWLQESKGTHGDDTAVLRRHGVHPATASSSVAFRGGGRRLGSTPERQDEPPPGQQGHSDRRSVMHRRGSLETQAASLLLASWPRKDEGRGPEDFSKDSAPF
jgi:hypothetical protein